jgi:hypothetical protein
LFIQTEVDHEECVSKKEFYSKRLYACRTIGGHCHNWNFGRATTSCSSSSARSGAANAMLEQPKAIGIVIA